MYVLLDLVSFFINMNINVTLYLANTCLLQTFFAAWNCHSERKGERNMSCFIWPTIEVVWLIKTIEIDENCCDFMCPEWYSNVQNKISNELFWNETFILKIYSRNSMFRTFVVARHTGLFAMSPVYCPSL